MAFHVRDGDVDLKVRAFAKDRGVGITEAIRLAVEEANAARQARVEERLRRTRAIIDEISTWPRTGLKADKAFFDELSGD